VQAQSQPEVYKLEAALRAHSTPSLRSVAQGRLGTSEGGARSRNPERSWRKDLRRMAQEHLALATASYRNDTLVL
jgi:hypothetical protein